MRCVIELRLITLSFALRGEGTKDGVLVILSLFTARSGAIVTCLATTGGQVYLNVQFPTSGSLYLF